MLFEYKYWIYSYLIVKNIKILIDISYLFVKNIKIFDISYLFVKMNK